MRPDLLTADLPQPSFSSELTKPHRHGRPDKADSLTCLYSLLSIRPMVSSRHVRATWLDDRPVACIKGGQGTRRLGCDRAAVRASAGHSLLTHRSLHARVASVAGVRIPWLGGILRSQI